MASAEVKITYLIDSSLLTEFVAAMAAFADEWQDGKRCKAVSHEDMRCEGVDGHSGDRHSHGRFSWPVVAVGHVPHQSPCVVTSPHHHWRDPNGFTWVMPGTQSDCVVDHLATWMLDPTDRGTPTRYSTGHASH